jgi:hypothetical protein
VEVFAQGLGEALTYLDFPSGHQRHIKSTNVLERLIREVKRRTGVVGVFPGEGSLVNLAKGHGGLGFPALPGHGPALGRGRETHKNRDLTSSLTPYPEKGMRRGGETKVREEGPQSHPRPWEASLSTFPSP